MQNLFSCSGSSGSGCSAGIDFLLQGKWKQSKAVLRAHSHVLKNRKQFLAKRSHTIKQDRITENYSVVWQYYIAKKRKYSQL